jgi:monovalent cation:proton antiporter-2 (CPA2) family protein
MHGEGFFYQAFVYLTAAVVSVPIAKRLGLGSVLGYLIAGVAIGPFALGLIGEGGKDVMHFAEFGVVMMLFVVGLELQPAVLWRLRGPVLGMGGLQVVLTTVAIGSIGLLFGLPWQSSLAIGMILALSSTAIVLQTLNEKGLMKTDGGQRSFAVLLFQDIAVIPMLAILPLLATGGGHAAEPVEHSSTWVEGLPGWVQTVIVLGAVAIIVVAGRYLLRPVFRFIAGTRLRELFTAAALLLVIGIALLMTRVGLSPALGTFVAGVVLANSEYRHELESDIEPFKGLLLGLFFIAVGASIDFNLIAAQPGLIAGLVAILLGVKLVVLFVLGRVFRMGLDQNLLFAFALAQGGEFAFVLFSFATGSGVLGEEIVGPLIAVVALSMGLTPLLMLLNEKLLQPRFGTKEKTEREADAMDEDNPVIVAGFGRFGHIVGRFLKANGVGTTVLDLDSDHVDLLRKLGLKVFYGDASRHDLLHSAGAANAKLIVLAIDESEKNLEIIETCRKHFPNLQILARAPGRAQAYDLLEAGVDNIYRDTLDSSLRMGIDAMRLLGYRSHHAHRAARKFRRHDEESVRELARMRHDTKAYITRARQRIQDMEEILLGDMEEIEHERDAAWDTTTLRREYGSS